MKVESWPIERVVPYDKNPRRNEDAVAKVAASLKEFGFRQPLVVDGKRVLIVGHTRLLAAKSLGMRTVPVHVATGLSPTQVRAYRLADNRTAQEADWDNELLAAELRALDQERYDLALTGFDQRELDALLAAEAAELDKEEVPTLPAKPVTRLGDLIRLGSHTLVCGDATDPSTIETAAAGARLGCVWTDPPYGVEYVGKTRAALRIQNDGAADLPNLLARAFAAADPALQAGARFYVAAPAGPRGTDFRLALLKVGWTLHQVLVWVKQAFVLGHSDYHYQHEDVLYGWKPGDGRLGRGRHAGSKWYGDHAQSSVLSFDRPMRSTDHPTMKPIALVAHCLKNSTKAGEHVLDPFSGSGTTLMACESLGRVAHCVELDPRYCDVIVERWEHSSGLTATRERPRGIKRAG